MPNGQLKISTISNMELVNITSEIDKILQNQSISRELSTFLIRILPPDS